MASANGDDDYESDPEEARLSLALRRRVASDDEDGGEVDVRVSDEEFDDDQGVPEEYDDDDEEEEDRLKDGEADVEIVNEVREVADGLGNNEVEEIGNEEEKKKKQEPFAVPTAGAFYMHDDRFRENAAGRHRMLGARKIWESRDERRWGHDKFEELTSPDGNYSESRRNFKEHHQGRGRGRHRGGGRGRGNRLRIPEDYDNQVPVPAVVRGRGPRRYDRVYKRISEVPQTQYKQSGKSLEKAAHSYSEQGLPSSSVAYEEVPAKKNMVASNLSSASPPFYPSGASSKDLNAGPKIDTQYAKADRDPQPSSISREKGVGDSLGLNKLHLEDSMHPSGSASNSKGPPIRTQGRGRGYAGHMPSPSASHIDHASKVSGVQFNPSQQGPPFQKQNRAYARGSTQQVSKHTVNRSQVPSSPPGSLTGIEGTEESQSESGKSKINVVPKASSVVQSGALGPFMYNGGQIMGVTGGNMGVAHGDPNFPTFLPVMQFGAQHTGGIGVPAVGMAFPGYVQPQHGQGSSEMTWLPVLAGGAGALGATYCPPYMLDGGTYNPQLPGPPFVASSSFMEANTNKAHSEWNTNSSQKPEHAGEEFDQRQNQNKPRRYSEMKFGQ